MNKNDKLIKVPLLVDAKLAELIRGISSREDLLAAQFECADRIDALGRHMSELAALESRLSRLAADYAASHPEAMDKPLAPCSPRSRRASSGPGT